jgi:hypothetical protein
MLGSYHGQRRSGNAPVARYFPGCAEHRGMRVCILLGEPIGWRLSFRGITASMFTCCEESLVNGADAYEYSHARIQRAELTLLTDLIKVALFAQVRTGRMAARANSVARPRKAEFVSGYGSSYRGELVMRISVLVSLCLCFGLGALPNAAGADVHVGIHITLPPLRFAGEPELVVVPSGPSYVYVVPGEEGLYFYGGYWYRTYGGRWYRSTIYNGPWRYVEVGRVPRYVVDVPRDYYRRLPPGYHRIPYSDLHRHWREWDRDRHWHRYDWYKRGYKEQEMWRREHHGPSEHGGGRYGHGEQRYERRQPRPDHGNVRHDHGSRGHDRGGETHGGGGAVKPYGPGAAHPQGKKAHHGDRQGKGYQR